MNGRRPRDWVVDAILFLVAAAIWALAAAARLGGPTLPGPSWLLPLDLVLGALGCLALWLRRRWPVGLALVLVALSTFSELVGGAMVLALFTVAVHRPPRTTGAVFALSVLAAAVYAVLRPDPGVPSLLVLVIGVLVQGAAVGWGLFVHYRRRLAASQRDRAARAATEAHLRAEQAQQRARDEIAREMHDVLGHRLSLLSVHAGALEFRPDAPAEEIARAAKVIRESAHQALQDLREVIGVLRAPTEASPAEVEAGQPGTAPSRWASASVGELPQPTLADVQQLVAESSRAGMRVALREETGGGPVPELVGRTAYRVVQEALTNARKHAAGAEVRVRLAGTPGHGLTVEVCNGARPGTRGPGREPGPEPRSEAGPAPGDRPGQGLVGLAERVALADGRLEHGPTAAGGWRLAAWLPWPA